MKHGEVWDVDFSPQIGDEIKKIRPAVIVNHDSMGALKLKVVVPITDVFKKSRLWHVPLVPGKLNGLTKHSVVDCFQIKSISQKRFVSKRGKLSTEELDEVKLGIMKVLNLL